MGVAGLYRDITLITENQMEHDMEAGACVGASIA